MAGGKLRWLSAICIAGALFGAEVEAQAQGQEGDGLAAATLLSDGTQVIDLGSRSGDRAIGAVAQSPGLASRVGNWADIATVALKVANASEETGHGKTYVLLREWAATVTGNYAGEVAGVGACTALIGTLPPGWVALSAAVVGLGAKKLVGYLVSEGMDRFAAYTERESRNWTPEETWRKARALERWQLELFQKRLPPMTPADIEMWSRMYDNPDEPGIPSGNIDEAPQIGPHQIVGTWTLDSEALLASADAVAARIGRDPDQLRSLMSRVSMTITVDENGTIRTEGTNPSGSGSARGKWRIEGGRINISEVQGDDFPPLLYKDGNLVLSSPELQGMQMVFHRR